MPAGAVYVGRPTRWGNQFTIHRLSDHEYVGLNPDGTENIDGWGDRAFAARWATDRFTETLTRDLAASPTLRDELTRALAGHDLACWCPLEDDHGKTFPCHADVLLQVANAPS